MPFPRYPDLVLLPRRPEIMSVKNVICCEKLHGSNFRVHLPLGMTNIDEIQYGSRDVETGPGVDFPLKVAMQWFQSRPELLQRMFETIKSYGFSEVTVFGEAFGPGIHSKGVKYTDGQEMLFRAFDIMVGQNFLTHDLFCEVTEKMGLPRVPVVWSGEPTVENFDALLGKPSVQAALNGVQAENNIAEGIVIRSNPLLRDVFGQWLIVKHKWGKFSEVSRGPAEPRVHTVTPADNLATKYVTEGRLLNALGRLQDRGQVLTKTMKDMPIVLAEMVADIRKECDPAEWEQVGSEKQFSSSISKILGPIYRKSLETKE